MCSNINSICEGMYHAVIKVAEIFASMYDIANIVYTSTCKMGKQYSLQSVSEKGSFCGSYA